MLSLYNLLLGLLYKIAVWISDNSEGTIKTILVTVLGLAVALILMALLLVEGLLLGLLEWIIGTEALREEGKFYEFSEKAYEEWKSRI